MSRILIVDHLPTEAIASLRQHHDVVVELRPPVERLKVLLAEAQILILRSGIRLDAGLLSYARALTLVIRAGTGLDNIDEDALRAAGIRLERIPAESAQSVAELAIGLLLVLARHIARADRELRRAVWRKGDHVGDELDGKVVGVVGLGAIGQAVARIAGAGFGMTVLANAEHLDEERVRRVEKQGVALTGLDRLLRESFAVVLAVPLTTATRGLIGRRQLELMPQGALLVNVARAAVVDQRSLSEALSSGHLGGAALDVHDAEAGESPLAAFEHVVATPHLGAMTRDAQGRVGRRVLDLVGSADA